MITNEQERYWLAGIMEGEGSFYNRRKTVGKYDYNYIVAGIQMTDYDIIERVRNLIAPNHNIHIYQSKRPNEKPLYSLHCWGELAIDVMLVIRDLMGKRRQAKIDELLASPTGRVYE